MSDEAFEEFASELYVLVVEGAYLWEFAGGTIESTTEGTRRFGPWNAADCASALHLWLEAGFLTLVRQWPEELPVREVEARRLLALPTTWHCAPDGSTNVSAEITALGEATSYDNWRQRLEALRP